MKYQDVIPHQVDNSILASANLKKDVDDDLLISTVSDFCGRIHPLVASMRNRYPDVKFEFVFGIGSSAWDRLFPNSIKPSELQPFLEIKGATKIAPATNEDFFFSIRADKMSVCYQTMLIIHKLLKDIIDGIEETHGFRFKDGRACVDFVDGTENPCGDDEINDVVYIDELLNPYNGGTYLYTQKYTFAQDKWDDLPIEKQELIVGRKKDNDLELSDDIKPNDAHNQISKAHDNNGEEIKIMRANIVFGSPLMNEFGTYFLGYSKTMTTTIQMLQHMFEGQDGAINDSILNYLTPITGCVFYIPTYEQLDKIANNQL